jgi:hypothetical protein
MPAHRMPLLSFVQEEHARLLRARGWSLQRIGEHFEVSTTTAWRAVRHVEAPRQRKVRKMTREGT